MGDLLGVRDVVIEWEIVIQKTFKVVFKVRAWFLSWEVLVHSLMLKRAETVRHVQRLHLHRLVLLGVVQLLVLQLQVDVYGTFASVAFGRSSPHRLGGIA